jgi:D-alanyl-D-alanine carboxypeptidase
MKISKWVLTLSAFSVFAFPFPATAESLTDDQFVALLATFQKTLDEQRIMQKLPGATAAFVLSDGRMGKVASGYADVERRVAMTPDTRMLGASTGKTYVSAVANLLAEQGIWSLDDKLSKYLGDAPWFKRLPNSDDITIKMLLRHRSGINNYYDNPEFLKYFADAKKADPNAMFGQKEIIEFVLDKPPLFKADKGFYYTDVGYILIGLAMEKATKRSYYDLVREKILDPQNLTLTAPSITRRLPGLAQGYANGINPLVLAGPRMINDDGVLVYDPAIEFTGGGLITNSGDLARWAKSVYGGHFLKPETTKQFLARPENQAGDKDQNPDGGEYYGMAVNASKATAGMPMSFGHGGYIPGYITGMEYYPKYDVSVAFQTNTELGLWEGGGAGFPDYKAMQRALEAVVINAVADKPPVTP